MIIDEMVKAAADRLYQSGKHHGWFPKYFPESLDGLDSIANDEFLAIVQAAIHAAELAAWRPFSEAPKDGTIIDVYHKNEGVFSAHYVESDAHLSSQDNPPEGDYFWFATTGEDLTGDLPTMFRYRPAAPR